MANTMKDIVLNYQSETGLKLKKFGAAFGVGHPTIINWREGRTEPQTDLLLKFIERQDWRGQFARECLHLRHPDRF